MSATRAPSSSSTCFTGCCAISTARTNVVYVRNITDIDDKIMDQARQNGESIRALTDRTTADFQADLAALGCLPPTHEPRATEHVAGMIA